MVDIRKSDEPKPGNLVAFAFIILALGALLFGGRVWNHVNPSPGSKSLVAVLFVTTQEMSPGQGAASASVIVEEFCDDLGIERRRLLAGQSTDNAETWLGEMNQAGNENPPSLVFLLTGGKVSTIPIPDGIEKTVAEIEARK